MKKNHTHIENSTERIELYNKVESLAKTGAWEYDILSKKLYWTTGMYELFGIRNGEQIQPSVYLDVATKESLQPAQDIVQKIEKEHSPFDSRITIKVRNSTRVIKVIASVELDDANQPVKMFGMDQDITDLKSTLYSVNASTKKISEEPGNSLQTPEQKYQELVEEISMKNMDLEALAEDLKTFYYLAAHEFEENLRKMYTGLEFIAVGDAKNLSNEGRANVRRIQSSVQKMKLITSDILTYSNIQPGEAEKKEVNIDNLILSVAEDIRKRKDTNLNVTLSCPVNIYAYGNLMSLLVYHIIDNATKFNSNSHINIQVECEDVSRNFLSVQSSKKYTAVSFTDNGIGFQVDDPNCIFRIFFKLHDRAQYRGSGIGLAVCKKIMDIHHGFISAHSEEGTGTTVTCYFPLPG